MADRFDVGDIIKMKKPHPCVSQEWEVLRGRCGFPAEVHGVRASDHGVEKARRKEYETDYKKGETG